MFPKSRRLVFAYCLYFFSVGALDTYARCMEDSEAFGTHTEVLARENLISHAGNKFFHCTDELNFIDFYGPCDYDPHGKDSVQTQKRDLQHRLQREYNNN